MIQSMKFWEYTPMCGLVVCQYYIPLGGPAVLGKNVGQHGLVLWLPVLL